MSEKKPFPQILDTIIVGAGPSGLSAGIYAARRKLKTLLLCGRIGGSMHWYSRMENASGVTKAVMPGLMKMFLVHMEQGETEGSGLDFWVRQEEKVIRVTKKERLFQVSTDLGIDHLSETLIIASGRMAKKLDIPGEEQAIQGNGMSSCGSSDALLYRGKKMIVLGGGDAALDVALQLSKLTDNITIMTDFSSFDAQPELIGKVSENAKITVKQGVFIREILLDQFGKVRGIRYEQNGQILEIDCEGIFKEIGSMPETGFISDFLHLNDRNEIPVDRECRTEYPGLFAAGDCTDIAHNQVIVSLGCGAIAALEAHQFLLNKQQV